MATTRCKVAAGSGRGYSSLAQRDGAALVGAQFLDQAGQVGRAAQRAASRRVARRCQAADESGAARPRAGGAQHGAAAHLAGAQVVQRLVRVLRRLQLRKQRHRPSRASASRLVQFLQGADIRPVMDTAFQGQHRGDDGAGAPDQSDTPSFRPCAARRNRNRSSRPTPRNPPPPRRRRVASGRTSGCPRRRSISSDAPASRADSAIGLHRRWGPRCTAGAPSGCRTAPRRRRPGPAAHPRARPTFPSALYADQSGAGMVQACSSGMAPWSTR